MNNPSEELAVWQVLNLRGALTAVIAAAKLQETGNPFAPVAMQSAIEEAKRVLSL